MRWAGSVATGEDSRRVVRLTFGDLRLGGCVGVVWVRRWEFWFAWGWAWARHGQTGIPTAARKSAGLRFFIVGCLIVALLLSVRSHRVTSAYG